MLALPAHGFVMLSMPKCASTSLEEALAPRAEMVLTHTPRLKHINCQLFHEKVQPVLRQAGYRRDHYELVSLVREPVEWLESWWRYRSGHHLRKRGSDPRYTDGMSFEEYAGRYVERDGSGAVVKGRPTRFLALDGSYRLGVDHVFALERPEAWQAWVSAKMGEEIVFPQVNRSKRRRKPPLSDETRARLVDFFAPEYDVYDRLRETGAWSPPAGYVPAGSPANLDRAERPDPAS